MPHMASIILKYALSITTLLSAFINNKCWISSKAFFCFYWYGHMIFILQFVNMMCHTDELLDIKPSLHPWDKSHLVMVYAMYCWIWLPDICWGFCNHVIQWYWDKIFVCVLSFSAIPIKIPTAFLTKLEQLTLKLVWKHKKKTQKKPNSQKGLETEQSWSYHTRWLQAILQSFSNQNSMVLDQRQTHTSIEQRTQNKPMLLIWSTNPWHRRQE